ncbi:hypothetical protein pb186bvf_006966 [Paramecium bursaria]
MIDSKYKQEIIQQLSHGLKKTQYTMQRNSIQILFLNQQMNQNSNHQRINILKTYLKGKLFNLISFKSSIFVIIMFLVFFCDSIQNKLILNPYVMYIFHESQLHHHYDFTKFLSFPKDSNQEILRTYKIQV